MINEVLSTLKSAHTLLSDQSRWARGSWARDGNGIPCRSNDPGARKWCAVGAISHLTDGKPLSISMGCLEAIDRYTPWKTSTGKPCDIMAVNDSAMFGYEAVMMAFESAIRGIEDEIAEREGARVIALTQPRTVEGVAA